MPLGYKENWTISLITSHSYTDFIPRLRESIKIDIRAGKIRNRIIILSGGNFPVNFNAIHCHMVEENEHVKYLHYVENRPTPGRFLQAYRMYPHNFPGLLPAG